MPENKPAACHLADRSLIKISGAEAESFLQNLVTNSVSGLRPGRLVYSCLLTPQGRFLHDFFISRDGDDFFLECEAARREDLLRRLKIFRLRAKVTIEDCHGLFQVYAAEQPPEGIKSFKDPRLDELGCRFYLPAGQECPQALPLEKYRDRRISLGVPEGGAEMKPETDTLANVNLDHLHAVSWEKGCYVGQEITTMTKDRGVSKRRMVIVTGHMLMAGDILTQNGHEVGEVRAVDSTRTQGLAVLKLAALGDPAAPLTTGGGAAVSGRLPKWLKL